MKPGAIVTFRNRYWVLLPGEDEVLYLRPLTGTGDDVVAVHRRLSTLLGYSFPTERITPAHFPLPGKEQVADAQSVHLLFQAARLLLREGATPFRSFGRISIRPRVYQLVPLVMALRLETVRLLIADDVGVGKTIEAGLIVRELWEQGLLRRFAVLCPPYLANQWEKELREKFHFDPVVVNSATIGQLERRVPSGKTIYEYYPVQVLSIDFVKHDRNKHAFLLGAPECLIVDEAHGATPGRGMERHLRYELVKTLAADRRRHLILLTATPHSGIQESFRKLLGLLHPEFEGWDLGSLREEERKVLARHFVQRTRRDIESQWEGVILFPRRRPVEVTYTLSASYRKLFEGVYEFCTEIVRESAALSESRRRMRWWSALALLRCVMSSPRAAKVALFRRRQEGMEMEVDEEEALAYVYEPDNRPLFDETPVAFLLHSEEHFSSAERRRLRELERLSEAIGENEDTKLVGCLERVTQCLKEGYNPVVWCFYVETAEYVAEKLAQHLGAVMPEVRVACLTGRIDEEERRLKVAELFEEPRRVLVATDCLSEGINLQEGFNAVLHYDLPWNPNRLEQREGRVDRYGQKTPEVLAIRYYGKDNPVDGAVLRVLLKKAEEIRQTLGTHVPVPEEERFVVEALVHALFSEEKRERSRVEQLRFGFEKETVQEFHARWDIDVRREKESRTRFAQHALKPEEVFRELQATDQVLGDPEAVQKFVLFALQKLGVRFQQDAKDQNVWRINVGQETLVHVPEAVKQFLSQGKKTVWPVSFVSPTPPGTEYLGRNHPFVAELARYLFEAALQGKDNAPATRCGVIRSKEVKRLTTLFLLRCRFTVETLEKLALAEEVLVAGFEGETPLSSDQALALLTAESVENIPLAEKRELLAFALDDARKLLEEQDGPLAELLRKRSQELEGAYRRVRQSALQSTKGVRVSFHWPPDLLGILVLQPALRG